MYISFFTCYDIYIHIQIISRCVNVCIYIYTKNVWSSCSMNIIWSPDQNNFPTWDPNINTFKTALLGDLKLFTPIGEGLSRPCAIETAIFKYNPIHQNPVLLSNLFTITLLFKSAPILFVCFEHWCVPSVIDIHMWINLVEPSKIETILEVNDNDININLDHVEITWTIKMNVTELSITFENCTVAKKVYLFYHNDWNHQYHKTLSQPPI